MEMTPLMSYNNVGLHHKHTAYLVGSSPTVEQFDPDPETPMMVINRAVRRFPRAMFKVFVDTRLITEMFRMSKGGTIFCPRRLFQEDLKVDNREYYINQFGGRVSTFKQKNLIPKMLKDPKEFFNPEEIDMSEVWWRECTGTAAISLLWRMGFDHVIMVGCDGVKGYDSLVKEGHYTDRHKDFSDLMTKLARMLNLHAYHWTPND
jgi:hypothetical protein